LSAPRSHAVARPIVSSYRAFSVISPVKLTPIVWIMTRVGAFAPPCRSATRMSEHVAIQNLRTLSR
jgi:hypothetical protein